MPIYQQIVASVLFHSYNNVQVVWFCACAAVLHGLGSRLPIYCD